MTEELLDCRRADKLVGTVFSDRYEILSLVGEGGMGLVYKAVHTLMKRVVAIKIIRSELLSNQTLITRFKQEAMAVSRLKHPNIVTVHDFGVTADGAPYLVMDYIDGVSLAETIADEGALTQQRALPIFLQACDALQHAHKIGVVHRDLKASNLMICRENGRDDVVKVVDFGMAKLMGEESATFQELTQTGDVFGSPLYMSPEQCRGQKLDERSDIYSIGCVMYYALAGQPPCRGENVLDTLNRQINEQPLSLLEFNSSLPVGLDQTISKALRKNPEERYQSVQGLIADLEAIADGKDRLLVSQKMAAVVAKPAEKNSTASSNGTLSKFSHNFELTVIFGIFLALLIATTGFVSGRLFEEADTTQEENIWADLNQSGDEARAAGNYARAEEQYKNAVIEAMKVGKRNPRLAKSLLSLGATYAQQRQFARAEVTLKRAIAALEKCYGPDCPELSTVLVTLAKTYDEQGRKGDAKLLRARAIELLEGANSLQSPRSHK